eukprot:3770392-Pyramimonas_sp.AAC.1
MTLQPLNVGNDSPAAAPPQKIKKFLTISNRQHDEYTQIHWYQKMRMEGTMFALSPVASRDLDPGSVFVELLLGSWDTYAGVSFVEAVYHCLNHCFDYAGAVFVGAFVTVVAAYKPSIIVGILKELRVWKLSIVEGGLVAANAHVWCTLLVQDNVVGGK